MQEICGKSEKLLIWGMDSEWPLLVLIWEWYHAVKLWNLKDNLSAFVYIVFIDSRHSWSGFTISWGTISDE